MLLKVRRYDNSIFILDDMNVEYTTIDGKRLFVVGTVYDAEYRQVTKNELYVHLTEFDKGFWRECRGAYSIIFEDGECLRFFSDAMGLSTLYYEIDEEHIMISDCVNMIVEKSEHKYNIDFCAWAELLSFYFILGSKTLFKEIKTVSMGELLIFKVNESQIFSETICNLCAIEVDENADLNISAEKCAGMLKKIINKMLHAHKDESVIVPLSGGWDSRLITCLAQKSSIGRIYTYTTNLDYEDDREEKFARQVAIKLDVFNQVIDINNMNYVVDEFEEYALKVDYECSMHFPFYAFYREIQKEGAVIFDGLLGDVLLRALSSSIGNENSKEEQRKKLFERLKRGKLEKYYTSGNQKGITNMIYKSFSAEMDKCQDNVRLFYLNGRKRALLLNDRLKRNYINLYPFCDIEFVEFALAIPDSIVSDPMFYKKILEYIDKDIARIFSTNDFQNEKFEIRNSFITNDMTKSYLLDVFNKHYADVYGIYEPIMVIKDIESECSLQNRRDLLNLLCYQKWIERYAYKVCSTNIINAIEEYSEVEKNKNDIQYFFENDYRKEVGRWQNFYEKNRRCDHRMKFITTMDVEGFDKYDPRAIHTAYDQEKLIEHMVYGHYNEQSVLEKLVALEEVPFTFFVEIYSDIYKNDTELSEILKLCDSGRNEAGLHCHPFSLSKEILDEMQLPYFTYRTTEGIDKIVRYGQERFRHALGKEAFSYRAGSFEVYSEYLKVLYKNGIRVDSSLYNESAFNHSVYQEEIYNLPIMLDGVTEVPITTFYDTKGYVCKFDLNMLNFQQKLEAIVKNMILGTYMMTMLCHSWSVSKAVRFLEGGKLYHKCFDENVWDEFQYIVEFMLKQRNVDFITMQEAAESVRIQKESHGEYLVDLNGRLEISPAYALPPEYGQMRGLNPKGFLNMKKGVIKSAPQVVKGGGKIFLALQFRCA